MTIIEVMEDYGVEIVELSDEIHNQMRDVSQNVYDGIVEQAGEKLMDLYL